MNSISRLTKAMEGGGKSMLLSHLALIELGKLADAMKHVAESASNLRAAVIKAREQISARDTIYKKNLKQARRLDKVRTKRHVEQGQTWGKSTEWLRHKKPFTQTRH